MCHVQSLEKDFYLGALGSFDHDFTHVMHFCCLVCVDNNKNEDLVQGKHISNICPICVFLQRFENDLPHSF